MKRGEIGWIGAFAVILNLWGISPVKACPMVYCDLECRVQRVQWEEKKILEIRGQLAENPLREDLWILLVSAEDRQLRNLSAVEEEWRKVHWEEVDVAGAGSDLESVFADWARFYPESSRRLCARADTLSTPQARLSFLQSALDRSSPDPELENCYYFALWSAESREEADAWRSARQSNTPEGSERMPDLEKIFHEILEQELEPAELESVYRELSKTHSSSLSDQVMLCEKLSLHTDDDFGCHREMIERYAGYTGRDEREDRALWTLYWDSLYWSDSTEDPEFAARILASLATSELRLKLIREYFAGGESDPEGPYCPFVNSLWNQGFFEMDLTSEGICAALSANLGVLHQCGLVAEAEAMTRSALSYREDKEIMSCDYIPEMKDVVRREVDQRLSSPTSLEALLEASWMLAEEADREDCTLLEAWVKVRPEARSARLLGECREKLEDGSGARESYLLAAELGDYESLLHVASVAIQAGDYGWALEILEDFSAEGQGTHRQLKEAQWLNGRALMELERLSEAWDALEDYYLTRIQWLGESELPWIDRALVVELAQLEDPDRLNRYLSDREAIALGEYGRTLSVEKIQLDSVTSYVVKRLLGGEPLLDILHQLKDSQHALWADAPPWHDGNLGSMFFGNRPVVPFASTITPGSSEEEWLRNHVNR